MKIQLDHLEVVAILTEWGKVKYGTHNVSIECLSVDGATMAVTLADGDFGSGATKITMEKFGELAKRMRSQEDLIPADKELFMPSYDASALTAI